MGRGGNSEALTDAKSLLYGRRPIRSRQEKTAEKRKKGYKHSKFSFAPRRLGIDKNEGLKRGGGWLGTSHWASYSPKQKWVDKFASLPQKDTHNYQKAIEKQIEGPLLPVELGPVEDRGGKQATPAKPRYIQAIKHQAADGYEVNADFIAAVEQSCGQGEWLINSRDRCLVYRELGSQVTRGIVLPRLIRD